MLCNECNNSGLCAWCKGTGKEALASVCRSCYGSGLCLSCGSLKFERRPAHGKLKYDTIQKETENRFRQEMVDCFEDINFIMMEKTG